MEAPQVNRCAQQQARMLYVTPMTPFSTHSGSEQRSALLLETLAALGEVLA